MKIGRDLVWLELFLVIMSPLLACIACAQRILKINTVSNVPTRFYENYEKCLHRMSHILLLSRNTEIVLAVGVEKHVGFF